VTLGWAGTAWPATGPHSCGWARSAAAVRPGDLAAGQCAGGGCAAGAAGDPAGTRRGPERAWTLAGERAPGADGSPVVVDIDATIVAAYSEKQHAAPMWKKTFGLLTELRGLSLQFRQRVAVGAVTVPDHDRIR
jgi:hypothetical protein